MFSEILFTFRDQCAKLVDMSVDTNPIETPPAQEKPASKQYRKYEWPADRVTESQLNEMREVAHHLKRPLNQLISRAVTEFAAAVTALLPDGPIRADERQAIERGKLIWQPGSDDDRSPREEDLLADLVVAVEQVAHKLDIVRGTVETLRHDLQIATARKDQSEDGLPSQIIIEETVTASIAIEVAESATAETPATQVSTRENDSKARQLVLFDKTQFD